ncbi:MOB kinase activator-like 2 [Lamellibrachia satsuma]|nr:MOB kinase activator-like 2 [Lamellibrachia satsuma]
MDWFMGKSRRKEKDSSPVSVHGECRPYLDDDYVQEKIQSTDMAPLVKLPYGLNYNEWLATHTISFFEHINLMYGIVSEYCTTSACTAMTGPGNIQYSWVDEKGKKSKCAAPQYVDYVMTFTQNTIHDENVFPTKYGNDFPSSFEAVAKKIHRLLFHVLSHIYESHYELIVILRLHGHLNTLFQHFMLFNTTHLLLEDKETEALDELFQKLLGSDRGPAEDQGQGDVRLSESNALDNHKDCLTDSTQTNSQIPEK